MVHGEVLLTVYLVRHAESRKNIWHLPWTSEEQLDTLTAKGRKQATVIGSYLRNKKIVAIYSSPTGRTRETAKIINEILEQPESMVVEEAFASLRGGRRPDGIPVSWDWRKQQWASGKDPRPEGGESMADGVKRVTRVLEELIEQFTGKEIVIVTHGDICAALIGVARHTPVPDRYAAHQVPTGSVSTLIITDAGWLVLEEGQQPTGVISAM